LPALPKQASLHYMSLASPNLVSPTNLASSTIRNHNNKHQGPSTGTIGVDDDHRLCFGMDNSLIYGNTSTMSESTLLLADSYFEDGINGNFSRIKSN
jgi:hypothetical protein